MAATKPLAVLLLAAAAASAQLLPGDWLVSHTPHLILNSPPGGLIHVRPATGVVTTLTTVGPTGTALNAVTMAEDNLDLAVLTSDRVAVEGRLLRVTPGGVQTTLAVPGPTPDMLALDQDGTFVVARGDALLRVDPGTGATATLVALPGLRGVDIDQDTGNYLTGTMTTLLRVDRSTLAITTITAPLTDVRCLAFEPRTGATLVGQLSWLSRVTRAGVVSTVGPPVAASEAVRVDGETGNILGGTGNQVSLLTPSGALVTTRVVLTAFMVTTCVEFYGSRKVSGSGAATPGSSYTIRFAFPSSPGAAYLAVMSTGLRPGLPLPDSSGRVINLDFTSPLFGLSLGGIPGITTGFTGTLSPSGTASGTIAIPPGFPSGLRLFVSAVAVNGAFPSGLETANTWAFTINP